MAERGGGRRALAKTVVDAIRHRDVFAASREDCALWRTDLLSTLPLLVVLARLLTAQARANGIATKAIESYALSATVVGRIRAPLFLSGQLGANAKTSLG